MNTSLCIALGLSTVLVSACGREEPAPTTPSPMSFLSGTWRGTLTLQVNPGDPDAPLPTGGGTVTWTFEIVPNTNRQTFRASVRSGHPWLPTDFLGTTVITPGNTPPAQVSTLGDYASPRGCRGTFGSVGHADATHIDADFTGVDCNHATFVGRVLLTKE